jgi:DNA topoisomerase-1
MHYYLSRKLGFGASKTMQLAQKLYEGGAITYMRTDGVTLGAPAIQALRDTVHSSFGPDHLPEQPRTYVTRAKNAQEAHEAIRPTSPSVLPESLADAGFDGAAIRLYRLIRSRALASQMAAAQVQSAAVEFISDDGGLKLKATASRVTFPGHLAAFDEFDTEQEDDDANTMSDAARQQATAALAALQQGDPVHVTTAEATDHVTRPPGRFTEGTLVKALEELGIGRPSTYAPTIKLLQTRRYVRKEGKVLHAEPLGRVLTAFLAAHFPRYVDYDFTSGMEQQLDDVSRGEVAKGEVLAGFWGPFNEHVNAAKGLSGTQVLDELNEALRPMLFPADVDPEADPAALAAAEAQARECPSCGGRLSLKLSHKNGQFVGCSAFPECTYVRPIEDGCEVDGPLEGDAVDEIDSVIDQPYRRELGRETADRFGMKGSVRLMGIHPASGKEIFCRQGPFGPYLQLGTDADPEMRRIPLPKRMGIRFVTMKYALALVELPRLLGQHPVTGDDYWVKNGKYGPYISCREVTRSLSKVRQRGAILLRSYRYFIYAVME